MKIPPPIEHVDCPICTKPKLAAVMRTGKPPFTRCNVCEGESVLRKDGKPTLKTRERIEDAE